MARLGALLIPVLLCAGVLSTTPRLLSQQPSENPSLADAEKLLDAGRLDQATQILDTLAAKQPEPAGVERLRGVAYYEQGKIQSSADAFARALTQDPNDREAMQMEGVALFRSGKAAQAIPLLEKAHFSMARTNVDGNYVLGLCYLDTRRFDDARKAFASQYGFPPDSPSAYLLTARMMLRRDYLPVATEFAQKALTLQPGLPMAHLLLGQILLARSQMPEAIAEFQKERDLNPLFGEVYDRLGDAYLREGNFEQSQQALDRAILLEPNSAVPYILLGKVLLKQQSPVMAKMYLDKALALEPGNYITHTLLGQVYRSLGDTAQASHEFQTAEQIQNDTTPKLDAAK